MKVGNIKQAIILSLAAIGAIVFLFLRLVPMGPGIASSGSGVTSAEPVHTSSVAGLPTEILRDAFSHPALIKRPILAVPPEEKPQEIQEPAPMSYGYSPILGKGDPETNRVFNTLHIGPTADPKGKPDKNAGNARQPDKKPNTKLVLKGIMRTTTPLALITIDDKQDVTVGLGEYVDTTYRITQFSQNAVLLTSDVDKTWLYVGHGVTEK